MPVKSLYLIGGKQKAPRPLLTGDTTWYEYEHGVILQVDVDRGSIKKVTEYTSSPNACAPGDPILFKGGTIEAGNLYTCTQTEVITFSLPDFEKTNYISLPCFNDVHHVKPMPSGNLLIANSGLEMVMEIKSDGQVDRVWNVLGEEPWASYSSEIDYRKGINLKPHRAHPNYVFCLGNEIWATRFEKKDAICLTDPGRRIEIGLERVHDGLVQDGRIYFTTVNGNVVIVNRSSLAIDEVVNLNAIHDNNWNLGWCRGLLVDENRVWIGFSRIRPTKFREAVRWVRKGFTQDMPSHIACYDLEQRKCLVEIDVEEHGLNAIFSILPVPEPDGIN